MDDADITVHLVKVASALAPVLRTTAPRLHTELSPSLVTRDDFAAVMRTSAAMTDAAATEITAIPKVTTPTVPDDDTTESIDKISTDAAVSEQVAAVACMANPSALMANVPDARTMDDVATMRIVETFIFIAKDSVVAWVIPMLATPARPVALTVQLCAAMLTCSTLITARV